MILTILDGPPLAIENGGMNPVSRLQFRGVQMMKVAALVLLTTIFVVMLQITFGPGGTFGAQPAQAAPASDKNHYDPFLPTQWLYILDTRA